MALIDSAPLKDLSNKLGNIPKDAEFAGVVALTRTAKLIQTVVKNQLKRKFKLKNTFVLKGIRISPATKENVEAQVFTLDKFLEDQDIGGKRRSRPVFFVPGQGFEKATGINPRLKVIRKKFRGSKILDASFKIEKTGRGKARARPFSFTVSSGAELIAVRTTSDANPLNILYVTVRRAVSIRGRRFFIEPAETEYDNKFQEEYDRAFDQFVKLR